MGIFTSHHSEDVFGFFADKHMESGGLVKKRIPKGTVIFDEGDECSGVAFILNGSIRVSKVGKNGREIILYRITRGDSCILTISSILSSLSYPATAMAEEDTEAIFLTSPQFKSMMSINIGLQQFVFKLLSSRLLDVMMLVDEIIFHKIDERVIEYLLKNTRDNGDTIKMTHEALAVQLGTAREVISRNLKGLEKDGTIHLLRGKIKVMDRIKLEEKLSEYRDDM
ncbi:Crp/Fnr family transcriptional regulator [Bacillus benzoevorans]|uniref:CRP/FNR family transcriptional regulator n=1 Tax=Bacillus benzoevorans TaxID=1456 RepID=A0A7X0LWX0_9BACI|nr:Crp/Fnr family transcriptional regulator [Bacillus benzoevorans]MBB6447010.1 CRP/FNR family transcriptional regulator [Bacillus benzoevorans]